MNVVVILAHPYKGSFCNAMTQNIVEHLKKRGANVKLKNLVEMEFNCMVGPEDLLAGKTKVYQPDVKAEQDDIDWSDAIVTVCPIWFGMVPGFLKGYFDRVLMSGYGYRPSTGDGLLKTKRIYSIFTFGMSTPYLQLTKQMECISILWDNLFGMCGFKDVATKFYEGVVSVPHETRVEYLDDSLKFVDQIFDNKPGENGQIAFAEVLFKQANTLTQTYEELKK